AGAVRDSDRVGSSRGGDLISGSRASALGSVCRGRRASEATMCSSGASRLWHRLISGTIRPDGGEFQQFAGIKPRVPRHGPHSRNRLWAPWRSGLHLVPATSRKLERSFSSTTGMEHSPTSATGTAWERTPWHATQRAAWHKPVLGRADEALLN